MRTVLLLTALLAAPASGPVAAAAQRPAVECNTPEDCRERGLEAARAGDYERFHDFAWRAVQKGRPNDPELMALLARAQSLSGRPHDALIMLRRLADMGVLVSEAATAEDFRRVRALPAWSEFAARIAESAPSRAVSAGPPVEAREGVQKREGALSLPQLAVASQLVSIPGARAPRPVAPGFAAARPGPAPAARGGPPPPGDPDADPGTGTSDAVRFSTVPFEPAGLAYDAVSARFILGNRGERKLSVIGERSMRLANLVGEDSAGFGEIEGIAIDPREGDLWVASTPDGDAGPRLHKLQLISGRLLFTVEEGDAPEGARLTDIAMAPDGAVLALDAPNRRLLRLAPRTRELKAIAALDLDRPVSLAPGPGGSLYVASATGIVRLDAAGKDGRPLDLPGEIDAARLTTIRAYPGGLIAVERIAPQRYRITRIRLAASGRRAAGVDVLAEDARLAGPAAIAVSGAALFYLEREGAFTATGGLDLTIRRVPLPR